MRVIAIQFRLGWLRCSIRLGWSLNSNSPTHLTYPSPSEYWSIFYFIFYFLFNWGRNLENVNWCQLVELQNSSCTRFTNPVVKHVYQEMNQCADVLANVRPFLDVPFKTFDHSSAVVKNLLAFDKAELYCTRMVYC